MNEEFEKLAMNESEEIVREPVINEMKEETANTKKKRKRVSKLRKTMVF